MRLKLSPTYIIEVQGLIKIEWEVWVWGLDTQRLNNFISRIYDIEKIYLSKEDLVI